MAQGTLPWRQERLEPQGTPPWRQERLEPQLPAPSGRQELEPQQPGEPSQPPERERSPPAVLSRTCTVSGLIACGLRIIGCILLSRSGDGLALGDVLSGPNEPHARSYFLTGRLGRWVEH